MLSPTTPCPGGDYRGYRHTVCTSINHVVCHGIPNDKLRDGDIVNIDVTVILEMEMGYLEGMYPVGEVKRKAERLVEITYDAMMRGTAAVKPGGTTGDIGWCYPSFAEGQEKCSVVRGLRPAAWARCFHALPNIALRQARRRHRLEAGHVLHHRADDQSGRLWREGAERRLTATRDRSLSAQFEHAVGVTETGVEISDCHQGLHKPPYL